MNPEYKQSLEDHFKRQLEEFWTPNKNELPDIDVDMAKAQAEILNRMTNTVRANAKLKMEESPVVKMKRFLESTTPIGTVIRLLSVTPIVSPKFDEEEIDEAAETASRYIGQKLIVEKYNLSGFRALASDGTSISIAVGYDTYEIVRED